MKNTITRIICGLVLALGLTSCFSDAPTSYDFSLGMQYRLSNVASEADRDTVVARFTRHFDFENSFTINGTYSEACDSAAKIFVKQVEAFDSESILPLLGEYTNSSTSDYVTVALYVYYGGYTPVVFYNWINLPADDEDDGSSTE